MNKIFVSLFVTLFSAFAANAQVGIGTTTPDASAQLEVLSTSKGLLVPRMTLAQRNSIARPANALLIYQTDNTPGFYSFNGGQWLKLADVADIQSGGSGANGKSVLNGNSNPTASIGTDGDFYLNTLTTTLFGPKTAGAWPATGILLIGSQGPAGPQGAPGPAGTFNGTLAGDITGLPGATLIANGAVTDAKLATGISAAKVGLGNVNNTSDADKPVSTAMQTALGLKENTANKATSLASPDDTKYPTTKAVADAIAAGGGGGWGLAGTAGSVDGTSFIGTTDNVPLNIRVNNEKSGRIEPSNTGNVSWGYGTLVVNTGNSNMAIGTEALAANTTGSANTASGKQALTANTIGVYNTATGAGSLLSNTTGNTNTATGASSLASNTTGGSNTATGYQSLNANTTGGSNTATGHAALRLNTSGHYNTATGVNSLAANTTGSYNTASGNGALRSNTTGGSNTATGNFALELNSTGNSNTATGTHTLKSNTTGIGNTATGAMALSSNTTGENNTASGSGSLTSNTTGNRNTATGTNALRSNTTGDSNTANGYQALEQNTTGNLNTASGQNALWSNTTGGSNTANGYYALNANSTGSGNTATGTNTLTLNTTGASNTASGTGALSVNTSGTNNTALGAIALESNTIGNNNTAIGYKADVSTHNLVNATAIGYQAIVDASNKVQIGNASVTAVKLGGTSAVLETSQIKLTGGTPGANKVLTSDAAGLATWQTPASSGWGLTGNAGSVDGTSFIGTTDNVPLSFRVNNEMAGRIDRDYQNTYWGYRAGAGDNDTGSWNTGTGAFALSSNTTGSTNTANGVSALRKNTEGASNTAFGYIALQENTTGSNNTAVGHNSLRDNISGNQNTAFGVTALNMNITGTGNTALGFMANVSANNLTNATAIGNRAVVDVSNKVQIGNDDVSAVKLGGSFAVLETFRIKLTGGTPGANKVLTSDAAGLATWQTPASSGWGLTGNAGSVDGTSFIGTTDYVPLNFRMNNRKAGRIDASNAFWGYEAGNSNTTGTGNTATGSSALAANLTGDSNTAIGSTTLTRNTTGSYNTGIGRTSLPQNTTGSNNTAVGSSTLGYNIIANYNTAIGSTALMNNSTGERNTALGYAALNANTVGSNNTAIGNQADVSIGTLENATSIGSGAKVDASNKVQIGNTSVTAVKLGGTSAVLETSQIKLTGGTPGANKVLTSDAAGLATWETPASSGWGLTGNAGSVDGTSFIGTTDNVPLNIRVNNEKAGRIEPFYGNTFWGYQAGNSNTLGQNNTAIGKEALKANTTGQQNTAMGSAALTANTTGFSNTANGILALTANTTGALNTGIGIAALLRNTTGDSNVALGNSSLSNNTTGSLNTAVGDGANVSTGNLTNATAIGYNAIVNNHNKVRIGNTSVTVIEGQVAFTAASDRRFKTQIRPMDKGLDFIMNLKPVSYQMKNSTDKRTNWGFIAQDIEELIGTDNAVLTIGGDKDRRLGLRYTDFISPMVKAMQEMNDESLKLKAENEALKRELASIKSRETDFAARLAKLEAMLSNGLASGESKEEKTETTEK